MLERALHKIGKNMSSEVISKAYSGIDSDDRMFLELAANRLVESYESEAKVCDVRDSDPKQCILSQCEQDGVFEYLKRLDAEDVELEERKELREK